MRDAISILSAALKQIGIADRVGAVRDLSGGCIHRVLAVTLAGGSTIVAKLNTASNSMLLEQERISLEALANTKTVLTPRPLGACIVDDMSVLLMTYLHSASSDALVHDNKAVWERFGRELASLHQADAGQRYGFAVDNFIGSVSQPNQWCDDWVQFNREQRLGHQLRLAQRTGRLSADEAREIDRMIDRLDTLLPRQPRPSLLHGDLWSGNALPTASGRVAVIDPACSIGDGWADIAMMGLFGGFPLDTYHAYQAVMGERTEDIERRIQVYQLYHVLNHVNIFGRSYVGSALQIVRALRV